MWHRIRGLGTSFTRARSLDRELDDELNAFVDELTDRYIARGLSPAAARRAALVELGGLQQVKERVRSTRYGNTLETTVSDVRFAWRSLWRAPGFAIVAVATLALGIGATGAIFSLVHALLLQDLPFRDADRLVFVWRDLTASGYPRAPLAGPEIEDLRHRTTRFSGFGGIWSNTAVLRGDDPEQLRVGLVTSDFFTVLGAAPGLGRVFASEDDAPTAPRAILLSWPLWQRRFGADPTLVGRSIDVNGQPTTVIGVMPEGFRTMLPLDSSVPDSVQAWLLLHSSYTEWPRGQQFLRVVGRMKPGVPLADAQHEIAEVGTRVGREHAYYGPAGLTIYAVNLHGDSVRDTRPALVALFAGVAILLVIACVNVASLLVARALARSRETALRVALGAGGGRLLRQYAAEGLVLGVLGGVAGVAVGRAVLALLIALRPAALSRFDIASLNPRVLAFTAGIAITWGVVLSLAPLLETRRTALLRALQGVARDVAPRLAYRRRAALVVVQVALSVVLLVGAMLLVRAFLRLQQVDPGFAADRVVTFRLAVSGPRFRTIDAVNTFSQQLRAKLAALPGVTGVGAISHLPFDDLPNWGTPYIREGDSARDYAGHADTRAMSPGFFETVGAQLVAGRLFTEADDATALPVAIVDERFARRLWPHQSAIGRRFIGDPATSGSASTLITVVGVVRHLRHRQITAELREQIYFPVRQAPRNPMAYLVRTPADPDALVPQIRAAVRALDPTLPIYDVRPLSSYVTSARSARRFTTILAAAFAAVALLLAALGVYGVTAYGVTLRRREFGIRLALGAHRGQVIRGVMRDALRLAAWGGTIGVAGAAVAAGLMQSQLFEVSARDALSYVVAVATLAVVAACAAWLPARRASGINPSESLRAE